MHALFLDNHKQTFWANTQHPSIQAFELQPHMAGDAPKVVVAFSQQGMSFYLSYFIQKTSWLDFADFNQHQFDRQDYLWEQNCLECFFEFNHQSAYLEMNSNPNGAYNFYHFDDYRTPNSMPPKRDNKAKISYAPTKCSTDGDWHIRHINILLDGYFAKSAQEEQTPCTITKLNPTAILYQDGKPLYYATHHANPPDFHDKAYWVQS